MLDATTPPHPSCSARRPPGRSRALLAGLLALLVVPAAGAQMQRLQFDHLTTGFELDGQHRDLQCESCHANAIFKGTPKDCGACHGIGTAIRATAKPANHILTTDQCGGCHTPVGWKPVVNFDHTLTRGSCSSCHNGVQAQGKGPTHIQTDLECDACHTTLTWAGAVFSHQGITSGCASCHNGVQADGMPATHLPIGTPATPCEGCHSTTNFLSFAGTVINHGAVTAMTCASCHETAGYLGMHPSTSTAAGDSRPNAALDPNHPASGDCGMCHDTASFAGAAVKPPNHIPTNAPCVQCHTTPGQNSTYSVSGVHQGVTGCLACHGPSVASTFINISIVTTPANHMPIGSLDCNGSGCHSTANVNPGGFLIGPASINTPTLTVAGHTTVAAAVAACQTCHETAPYLGMVASTAATAGDSRPTAFDALHPASGDCGGCHTTTPTFISNINAGKPANHIPTSAPCTQCHTTPNNYKVYSVTGAHQSVTGCLACHGPSVATTFANVTIVTTPANHVPIGSLDCNGSGCHTTSNVNPGGFLLGSASINAPTLTVAGHTTVAGAVAACASCHETAAYLGMLASTAAAAGDSRPPAALDAAHPATGDCGGCHITAPTFANNSAVKPANHIPTSAPCAQCHTTTGNYAVYSVSGTHVGVTGCLTCHAPSVATTFANVTIVTTPANHMPIGSLDCNGSGCHTTSNVNPGGFLLGSANINTPTLTVAGHTAVASAVSGCQTCHETAPYIGMLVSTASTAGDSRPTALDKAHPTTGDCNGCHTTTPTFGSDQTSGAKPSNHIPTSAACTQCHTTAGNYAAYSVTGTHVGVTGCLICHGSSVATTFANVTIVTTPANHMPVGSLDCNGSGCHTTSNVNPGGFLIGTANINTPTLTVAGHTTVAAAVSGCQTCHQTAPYIGMIASTATAAGDSRPSAALDASHPTTGDCNSCHTTTPTFTSNETGAAKPANHIPTNAACTQCHTTAGNYALYVMGATGHTGITNNCAQCHAYGLSFYNMAPPTLVEPPSGATGHIPAVPPNGTAAVACELCHSPTAFTTFSGTVMKHAYVTSMKCESCHEYGMRWKTNSGVQLWTRDGPNHHAGQDCGGSGCHSARDKMMVRPGGVAPTRPTTPASTTPTARPGSALSATPARTPAGLPLVGHAPAGSMWPVLAPAAGPAATALAAHAAAAGTACAGCHSAGSGNGKPSTHIATSDGCQSCHTTLAWLPVSRVDHSQISSACVSCHNGKIATGKRSSHIATAAGCDSCHTTNGWTPARFEHAAVAPHSCATCHNAVRAVGMPRAHVTTALACDTCHGTLAWRPAKIDHTRLTASCASCHNNVGALGMSSSHLRTQRDCASCHSYTDWSAVRFRHASAAYPGDHRAALACTACHTTGTEQVTRAGAASVGGCAVCHSKDFNPAAHPRTAKGVTYTVGELANCSGACHVYSDATPSVVTRSRPGPRHRITDAAFRR